MIFTNHERRSFLRRSPSVLTSRNDGPWLGIPTSKGKNKQSTKKGIWMTLSKTVIPVNGNRNAENNREVLLEGMGHFLSGMRSNLTSNSVL